MKLILRQIALPPDVPAGYSVEAALKKLKSAGINAKKAEISRVSVDSRKKNDIKLVYSVTVECDDADGKAITKSGAEIFREEKIEIRYGDAPRKGRIAVIGFGPAGMFCSLLLAENGYDTVVFERGRDVEQRTADVKKFLSSGILDTSSNIQFGAGGAGTFSDGKLITRINDPACAYVLRRLVEFGAPDDILTNARPHIGTDILREMISAFTDKLSSYGADIRFSTLVTDIKQYGNGVVLRSAYGDEYFDAAVLASGHSARDTYKMLYDDGVMMEKKPFSVGCRIEHLQEDIDFAMYGEGYRKYAEYLPHAEYNLSYRRMYNGAERGVYSFCMCPGGKVICSSTETDGIVTNGMSYHKRDGRNANSALAVSVLPQDLPYDMFSGVEFQRNIERSAFRASNSFYAPVETVGSFLYGQKNVLSKIRPTYEPGTVTYDLCRIFAEPVTDMLKSGLYEFEKKIKGFSCASAVLTAPETRTSAPLRILRNSERYSDSIKNLYPCGEGAGYAGGITSAAADGINTALKIMSRFKPDK